jgi:hypothetical protein
LLGLTNVVKKEVKMGEKEEQSSIDTCGIKVVGGSKTENIGIVRCGKVDVWDVWKVRAL